MEKKDYVIAYPSYELADEVNGSVVVSVRRCAVAAVLREGTTKEDAVFGIGEAVCHETDHFVRKVGRAKAVGRAHSKEALLVPYSDLTEMVDYPNSELKESKVLGPLSGEPIPYGIVTNLENLLGG